MHIAHIDNYGNYQSCRDHSIGTAEIAGKRLGGIYLENTAYLAGILHDAGKFSVEFDNYIKAACEGKNVRRGSVIHSFAGCSYMLNKYHSSKLDIADVTSELISYAIAAHHGLFDCINENEEFGFTYRRNKQPQYDFKAIESFFDECISESEIAELYNKSKNEIEKIYIKIAGITNDEENDNKYRTKLMFYFGLTERLILSAVIDGDRTDTYNFMSKDKGDSSIGQNRTIIWDEYLDNIEKYVSSLENKSPIQKARGKLSDICKEFARNQPGIYQLSIPTGSGKTVSGLRYALHHAEKWNKKRIFYVAPLISILEQNAAVIKSVIGDSSIVLEHHSNLIIDTEGEDETLKERYQLLTETWDSPIVITTLVQFLNTLFGGTTSQVRRFSALAESVIILDEVQSVPWKMLSMFNLAINYLQTVCGATILLCSATIPDFMNSKYRMNISPERLLSPEQESEFNKIFKRSLIIDGGNYRLDEIPEYIKGIMLSSKSTLVVCNKKMQSEYLFDELMAEGYSIYHLSASMCMLHREKTLSEISEALLKEERVLCISTQVIEAGVDISFETVIRFKAGLDSIVQSNGRCNRNGESEDGAKTYIIGCSDENLSKLKEMQIAKNATTELLYNYNNNSEKYDNDLTLEKSVKEYYEIVQKNLKDNYSDYYDKGCDATILDLYASNEKWYHEDKESNYFMNQAFKTAGRLFEPLDSDTITIIVPYNEGKEIICDLCSDKIRNDIGFLKDCVNKAKKYTVSVMKYQESILLEKGAIYKICDGTMYALREKFYDESTGLKLRGEVDEKCNILIL